jgi:hypothetical protein
LNFNRLAWSDPKKNVDEGTKRVVPIDMGANELSPPYVLRIFRQFGFSDGEIEALLR